MRDYLFEGLHLNSKYCMSILAVGALVARRLRASPLIVLDTSLAAIRGEPITRIVALLRAWLSFSTLSDAKTTTSQYGLISEGKCRRFEHLVVCDWET